MRRVAARRLRAAAREAVIARVLIAGCGYVGCALGLRLLERGDTVFGLRRQPQGLPPGLQPVPADLLAPESLADLPAALDAVVYAASTASRDAGGYRDAYVRGQQNLLAALDQQAALPGRWLFVSSTRVYAQRDGSWVDEDSPTRPGGFAGPLLLEGEGVALAAPLPALVLRLGGIYGPGRTRLLTAVRRGAARIPTGPPRYTNRIHRDDCAGAIAHLLALPAPAPRWLGVDDDPVDRASLLRFLAGELGAPPPEGAEQDAPESNKRCRNARLRASGYRFAYPSYREGYAALIREAERSG